jgi:hypothetical protein
VFCQLLDSTPLFRHLEERVDDNRRLLRLAVHPKFARESSDAFWRKAHRLVAADLGVRKAALRKWFPEPACVPEIRAEYHEQQQQQQQHAKIVSVIKRFSYIFNRHFAAKNFRAPKEVQIMPAAALAATVSDETKAPVDNVIAGVASGSQRFERDAELLLVGSNSVSDSARVQALQDNVARVYNSAGGTPCV